MLIHRSPWGKPACSTIRAHKDENQAAGTVLSQADAAQPFSGWEMPCLLLSVDRALVTWERTDRTIFVNHGSSLVHTEFPDSECDIHLHRSASRVGLTHMEATPGTVGCGRLGNDSPEKAPALQMPSSPTRAPTVSSGRSSENRNDHLSNCWNVPERIVCVWLDALVGKGFENGWVTLSGP